MCQAGDDRKMNIDEERQRFERDDDKQDDNGNKIHHRPPDENVTLSSHGSSFPPRRAPNPMSEAGFLSRLTFRWPYPLLKLGMERPLEESDLPENLSVDESTYNRKFFEKLWQDECRRHPSSPSLHRAMFRDFLTSIWFIQPMMAATATAKVVQAVALGLLVESFEKNTPKDGYLWAGVLAVCGLIMLIEHHHVFFFTWHRGMQYRIAAVASIYDKSLRLSSTSHLQNNEKNASLHTSSGKVMNLASNDVERFIMASLFVSYLWWAPLQSLAILGVGIWLLGPAFAAGFALLVVVFVPMQAWLSKKFASYRSKIAGITDQRVTLVSQAVYGARVMKMSGWEWQFLERIQQLRKAEIGQIAKANRLKAWNEALFFSANVVISVVIFLVHVGTGGELTPRSVFTVMTLINVVQLEMTKHVSLGVMGVSECYVSLSRIQRFLEYPELPKAPTTTKGLEGQHSDKEGFVLSTTNMSCYWNSVQYSAHRGEFEEDASQLFLALSDISLDFRMGELTCIIGSVGTGKSALLQALVGELPVSSGTLTRRYQTLSYASQDPWIMDGTARENIVMGMEWNEEWYNQVVRACGLNIDFQQIRKGDFAILGDRGVQLSGGQRARVGLARALYRDADVLICDDPLSAVDAKVGRLIFYEAIQGLGVNRGKCVILATHQHQYVSESRCVLMTAGKVACVGSYQDCLAASDGKLTAHAPDSSVDNVAPAEAEGDEQALVGDEEKDLGDTEHPREMSETTGDPDDDGKEMNVTGTVKLSTFVSYAQAMGGIWVGFALLLLFAITQASVLVTVATLGRWAERPTEDQRTWDILGLVIGLACGVIFLSIFRAMTSFHLTVQASRRLHDGMAKAVLRAKIEFFDTNPLGRILNRFSADVGSNDDLLPHTLFDFLMIAFIVLGAVVTSMVVLPYTLIALPPLLWYFLHVRRVFVTTTRELKRLEGLARSPIFAMLSESLNGIATIRSNDAIGYFRRKFEEAHNAHSRAFFAFMASSRWVGFRMDSLVFLLLAVASFLATLFQDQGWFEIDSAILGLALSTLLQLAGIFQWCIRQSAEVVNQMVSVEVLGFENVPSEAPLELDSDAALVQKGWPQEGLIDVEQLSVRYRASLPLSLEKVSFQIPSGTRVGVVGRTGSGKSTLVQSLFRLLEAEHGSIHLAGVDISTLGLHTLRTHMSVIPQVPVLFSGCSVRDNLDPFHKHSDDAIQEALEDVHMASVVRELPQGWNSFVAEGGTNFSVGQRQLLCLARAILCKHRVLVLDEPTANVDRKTDQLLHEALEKSFRGATILSVAHRLDTVIDNDYILVLGNGHVLEYGTPADLLEKENVGHFGSMVRDTGERMSMTLRQRALEQRKSKTV